MSTTELIPLIAPLSSAEKFQLLQYLVTELGKAAGAFPLNANATYPVWTPYGIPAESADKLATMLAEERAAYDS
ncbi:MAG TPA: hypothetical protein P5121_19015 [Caldilineaceae bacterium]|nr:hypothetical protein [Caldilineaceae bacterium]HRW07206.1 hypothetical protein [Caldilineaceae bacterium]